MTLPLRACDKSFTKPQDNNYCSYYYYYYFLQLSKDRLNKHPLFKDDL